jgi:hypothetical protein
LEPFSREIPPAGGGGGGLEVLAIPAGKVTGKRERPGCAIMICQNDHELFASKLLKAISIYL